MVNITGLLDKKTKIVCTLGPASQSPEMLKLLIANGMNVARLNFAHGDVESHIQVIRDTRSAASAAGKQVAIMGDLPGPKMRIGRLTSKSVELERGQSFVLHGDEVLGDSHHASTSFAGLPAAVKPGDKIFVNDGFIQLRVEHVQGRQVHCKVIVGGELGSHKGVNLPGIELGICAFTARDREFLRFAAEQKLDAVSQSFVDCASDVDAVREAAEDLDYYPFIIAKIERARAVDNIEAILKSADGLMVARGDLGVEIPIEKVALAQKRIIKLANGYGKPVITATHMLESMITNRRPTRAEASDVANAIFDGTDCLMLSGETAVGSYPDEAVAVMSRIACACEPELHPHDAVRRLEQSRTGDEPSTEDLISLSIYSTADALAPAAIVAPTLSGATARRISRFRLAVWIIAVSPSASTCQNLQFSYGVHAVLESERPTSWTRYTYDWLESHGVPGNLALLTRGSATFHAGGTNHIEIVDLRSPPTEDSIW